jgi:branched-subunit amino acid aminotransferase/4-amino-4-deoxychorismate lyase
MKKEATTVNLNGTFYSAGKLISTDNRSFLYGDSVFETILAEEKILLWDKHYARLLKAAAAIGLSWLPLHTEDYLRFQIRKTLQENSCHRATVRVSVFRREGGKYRPETDACSYLIQVEPILQNPYAFPEKGLSCDLYRDILKPVNVLSSFKTGNALIYTLAARKASREALGEILLLNTENRLCESSSGNIFLVKEGTISTPSLDEGCVDGIMRSHLIGLLRKEGITVQERSIHVKEKEEADELWISNSTRGIRWVSRCGKKSYVCDFARKAHELLVKNTILS